MYGLPGEPQFHQPLMLAQRQRKQRGRVRRAAWWLAFFLGVYQLAWNVPHSIGWW